MKRLIWSLLVATLVSTPAMSADVPSLVGTWTGQRDRIAKVEGRRGGLATLGRQIRQAGEAVSPDDSVSLDPTGLDERSGDHRRNGAKIGDPRQQIVERGTRPAIGDLRDRGGADFLRDQHAGEMAERADAGMGDFCVLLW